MKEILTELALKILPCDEAIYYLHEYGTLKGAVLIHVDNFSVAGDDEFLKNIVKLTVLKVEYDFLEIQLWIKMQSIEKYIFSWRNIPSHWN